MTFYDALNLAPALLVGVGLMALAMSCMFMMVSSSGNEGFWPRVIRYASGAVVLMILGFFVFCGSLLTDDHLTGLATGLGISAQDMSWGFLYVCSGLMWGSGGYLMFDYAEDGDRRNGYLFIGLGVVFVAFGLAFLLGGNA